MRNNRNTTMNKLRKNTSGFSVVEGLLVLLIVVGIGAAGFVVVRHKDTKASTSLTPSTSSKATPTPVVSAVNYLEITQLHIGLPLTTNISDLIYTYTTSDDTDSIPGSLLGFSTTSLDTANPKCNAYSAFGMVYVKTSPIPADELSAPDSRDPGEDGSPMLYAHVNGYYLYWQSPQNNCLSPLPTTGLPSTSNQNIYNSDLNAFQTALKNAKPAN
jgi:hypothetical protein